MLNSMVRAMTLWALFSAPVQAATDQLLPQSVAAGLQAAASDQDVAALVLAYPNLAATLMSQAAVLGIASPSQVVSVLAGGMAPPELSALVAAAAEAAPLEADIIAAAAFDAFGDEAQLIGEAAIRGMEAGSARFSAFEIANETAEVTRALIARAPGEQDEIAQAISQATSTTGDSPASILAASAAIQTADIAPVAGDPLTPIGPSAPLSNLPTEAQNTPSPN
jgi:hypothetical protein